MSPRGEAATTSVRVSNAVPVPPGQTARYRRHVNVTPTMPQDALLSCFHRSHQLLPGSSAVSHLLGVPSPPKMDSTSRTVIPGISRAPTKGTSVVGKNATTAKMMCLHVLMVGATSCLVRVVHAFLVADARPTSCSCVDIFRQCGMACSKAMPDESCGLGTAWWTFDESRGSVQSCWHMLRIWRVTSIVVVEEWF